MTMRELAILSNISVSTVSKAFRDADDVSKETKERIFQIAKEQGCYGQFYKGKYHKTIVAILCPELRSAHYTDYIERLQAVIEQNDGIALISTYQFNEKTQTELIEYYASYLQVDGLIIFGLKRPLKKAYRIPIVSLLSAVEGVVDVVKLDLIPPIFEAVEHLVSLGHKHIAFLGEALTKSKESAVIAAIERYGISYTVLESDRRFEQAGEDGARQLLALPERPTALLCGYDYIAFGAMKYLKKKGYSIPEDFSVIGMDNIAQTAYWDTSLTTIDSASDEICRIAWDLLQKKQQNEYYHMQQKITLTGRLILRETTAPAKNSRIFSSK
ncbi:MAG: LacI family DNA-binding transcriptional regulator [Clostridia bacterium]|nr:LacI family DNA-binding transcriptional regulator [Clostridia bacterium]